MSPLEEDVPTEEFGTDAHIYRPPLVLRVGIVLGPALLFFIVMSTQQFGPSYLVLVPKDVRAKWLKIRLPLNTDEAFEQWLATLPNLDQRDRWRHSGK